MNAIIENNTRLAHATPALVQAFAPAERLPLDTGNNPAGQICLANEARFTSSYASEPLSNYATGWTDTNNIEKTLDFLFPPVQAPRRFDFESTDSSGSFLSEGGAIRL